MIIMMMMMMMLGSDDSLSLLELYIALAYTMSIAYILAIHIIIAYYYELGINKLSYAVSLLYHLYTPDARFFENKSL